MKLLNRVNNRSALKGKPYSPQEIDENECAERIWATIEQCRQESLDAIEEGYGRAFGKLYE